MSRGLLYLLRGQVLERNNVVGFLTAFQWPCLLWLLMLDHLNLLSPVGVRGMVISSPLPIYSSFFYGSCVGDGDHMMESSTLSLKMTFLFLKLDKKGGKRQIRF